MSERSKKKRESCNLLRRLREGRNVPLMARKDLAMIYQSCLLLLVAALSPISLYAVEKNSNLETATFAAGCFWGTEEFFRKIPGVEKTQVGFTGGKVDHPKYDDTHDGHTGHAEAVEIQFDPGKVSYKHLLDQFFKMHDPTTKNRQGNDVGSQYRSAIFYHGERQKKEALDFKKQVEKSHAWKGAISTEISEAKTFWPAEDYHQKYLVKNPGGYDNHYLRKISFDKK
jgi:methionine-S-sulfoxide reductase